MDYHTLSVADRLEHDRAAALDREHALRRSLADRGVSVRPARPVIDALHDLGVWLRSHSGAPAPRFSH